jgi:hypothetical protein
MSLITDIEIGSVISFNSKAVNDDNNYKGEVIGFATFRIAKSYTDIFTYNINVQTIDASVPETELLEFLLIELHDPIEDSSKYVIPFAKEWITEASLDIITTNERLDITIYDANATNVVAITDLLRGAGYKTKVTRIY